MHAFLSEVYVLNGLHMCVAKVEVFFHTNRLVHIAQGFLEFYYSINQTLRMLEVLEHFKTVKFSTLFAITLFMIQTCCK